MQGIQAGLKMLGWGTIFASSLVNGKADKPDPTSELQNAITNTAPAHQSALNFTAKWLDSTPNTAISPIDTGRKYNRTVPAPGPELPTVNMTKGRYVPVGTNDTNAAAREDTASMSPPVDPVDTTTGVSVPSAVPTDATATTAETETITNARAKRVLKLKERLRRGVRGGGRTLQGRARAGRSRLNTRNRCN